MVSITRRFLNGTSRAGFSEAIANDPAMPPIICIAARRLRWLIIKTRSRTALPGLRLEPENNPAYVLRGDAYRKLGQPRKALAEYDRAGGIETGHAGHL